MKNVKNLLLSKLSFWRVVVEVSKERHDNHNYGHNFLWFRQNGKTFLLLHLPAYESPRAYRDIYHSMQRISGVVTSFHLIVR